jgi:WS/DGAT/MGAT family acyltransferase
MDAAMLDLETPTNLMVINGVMILAAPLAMDDLKAVIRHRLLSIRRFRQRLVSAAVPCSTPAWEDDPDFDIDNHVHHAVLPPTDSAELAQSALQELVSELASVPLAQSRPLWDFYLVEGYSQGSALICRIHNSIGDGVSLVEVLLSITDPEPLPAQPSSPAHEEAVPMSEGGAMSRGRRRRLARKLLCKGLSLAVHPSRLVSLVTKGRQAAAAMGDVVLTLPDSPTAFKGQVGLAKRVAWSGPLSLDQVKAVGRAMSGTVNDTLLAAGSGALRRYLHGRGEVMDGVELHAAVPVNLRAEGSRGQLGNRVGTVFLPLPVGEADPVKRLQAVRRAMDRLKESYQAPATFAAMRALGRTSPVLQRGVVGILASRASAIMTNVVGPEAPRYLAGAPVEALLFWVPKTGGLALGVSILSYAGQVRLGVITDAGLVPDPEAIIAGFQVEFDALLELTREMAETPSARDLVAMLDEALATLDSQLAGGAAKLNSPLAAAPSHCQALTKIGRPCRNRALPGSGFCHVHA